jgi:cytochrome c oxidase cbb3-type subunit 1
MWCSAPAAPASPATIAPWFVILGYNFFIVIAGTGYLLGITQGKEYAEPEWYADLWLTVVWVVYLLVFLATLWKRKEPHIYVANWFYLAFIVTIAMLHLGNNATIPVSIFSPKSYIVWSGVQDAMVQWWYGHNAVGFFLTAGFLAIMYYFVPKRADRPVYSYRLSIVHFWALIFIYIWAGPHHLHYTALPDWAQTLGMTFSVDPVDALVGRHDQRPDDASGAWDKLRTDPVLRMMVVSLAFYGMSTFEGPLMSIKAVNSLSHYTDWTIGHVHSGALGWVAYISFGAIYCLVPWLWNRKQLYSPARQLALLGLDPRHRLLHLGDVGERHPAGPDVARLHGSRLPRILLHRDGRGDAPLLRHPRFRWRPVRPRRADHGLQHLIMTIAAGEAAEPEAPPALVPAE